MSIFQEHILDASDVCSSCFRLIRRERDHTTSATKRSDVTAEKTPYTRFKRTTSIDHGPADAPPDSIGVWCECGTESAYHRIWTDSDRCPTLDRFKTYVKRVLWSMERKGVTIDRQTTAEVALKTYREDNSVNEALAAGVNAGVQHAAATGGQTSNDDKQHTVS